MHLHLLLLALFAVNMSVIWFTILKKKMVWYRMAGYAVFVVLPFISVIFDQPRFELDYFWWRVAGVVLIVMGLALFAWARHAFKKTKVGPTGMLLSLVVAGPYKYVRHPQYLSLVFVLVGWWWVWAAVYSFYFGVAVLALIWLQAYLEEKYVLEPIYPDEYKEYKKKAGMFWVK